MTKQQIADKLDAVETVLGYLLDDVTLYDKEVLTWLSNLDEDITDFLKEVQCNG